MLKSARELPDKSLDSLNVSAQAGRLERGLDLRMGIHIAGDSQLKLSEGGSTKLVSSPKYSSRPDRERSLHMTESRALSLRDAS